jgi:peptidoglycan hydrolase-like protein with peptidoglycan-binding domain
VGVTSYKVYKNGTLVASPTGPTYMATSLSANTSYGFAVAASDAAGNTSAKSPSLNIITSAAPVTTYTLSASKTGSGVITGAGLTCGSVCSASVTANTTITLTAEPSKNFIFSSWSGACAGQGSQCTLTITKNTTVGASFKNDNTKKTATVSGILAADLSVGTNSSDVLLLQQFLNSSGYVIASSGAGSPGQETATFGGLTKAAVMRFQRAYSIPQTGTVGPLTRARINSLISGTSYTAPATTNTQTYAPTTYTTYTAPKTTSSSLFTKPATSFTQTLKLGSQGAEVVLLQRLLATQTGIYPQKLTNGIFNSDLEAAVQKFQMKYSLAAPGDEGYGVVGPVTRAKLNELWSR